MPVQATWIEVPAKDIERATRFYSSVFDVSARAMNDEVRQTRTLTDEDAGVGFSLNQTANFSPSDQGVLVYLNAGDQLDALLQRIPAAGGVITLPKTEMFEGWYYAIFRDTEGNQLALSGAG